MPLTVEDGLEAAALKTEAELYTPTGAFLKASDPGLTGYVLDGNAQQFGIWGESGPIVHHNMFRGVSIGIKVFSDGRVSIPGG